MRAVLLRADVTAFPVLRSLEIEKYALLPSSARKPFVINFHAGSNAIVGVNGSGKSTLIGIALRCLTGPFNLPSSASSGELGQIRPRIVPMPRKDRRVFASRVSDGAEHATAKLVLSFGAKEIEVKRSLADLALVSLTVDGNSVNVSRKVAGDDGEDSQYHREIANLLGVANFFDMLIVLHFLIFMLEDRRALVWDPNAQRQIFRVLFLPALQATEYAHAQQQVVSTDSAVRNIRNLITRHRDDKTSAKKKARAIADAEAERLILVKQAGILREQIESANEARSSADDDRYKARRDRLRAVETRDSLLRELERIKMLVLGSHLGPSRETIHYILGHLLAEHRCLVCGANPSPAAKAVEGWVRDGLCPVCGSAHDAPKKVSRISDVERKRLPKLEVELQTAEAQIGEAEHRIVASQRRFEKEEENYENLERRRIALDTRLVAVIRRIPVQRAAGGEVGDVAALRRMLASEGRRLKAAERRFRKVSSVSLKKVQSLQKTIASEFHRYVRVFMREDANLMYQTVKDRIGQGGETFEFPSFRLTMTGGAVAGSTVREEPGEVSQSQAEFVDLAFRMALMTVASRDGATTLVVDAPEASLDFVFAERAGTQLADFGSAHQGNRVIVTSYLPSDHFLRKFLESCSSVDDRRSRIVDLIQHAAPNAALKVDRPRYEKFLDLVVSGKATSNA